MCTPLKRRSISLGFTPETVLEGQHICYIFNDELERRRVIARFLESGLLAGEKVLYLVDTMTPEEMLDSLEELGVDIRSMESGMSLVGAAQGYCPGGTFSIDGTLELIRSFYVRAVHQESYKGARITGEVSWSQTEGRPDEAELLEYEARVNGIVADYPLTACCQYDARRFSGQMIVDLLSVHPVMIVRGQLVKNPYYIEPEIFLREFRSRRKERFS